MANDVGKLLNILSIPEVLARYNEINQLQPGQLVKLLELEGVSIQGQMSDLQGRLLRLEVKRTYPHIDTPWYNDDEIETEKTADSIDLSAETLWEMREASKVLNNTVTFTDNQQELENVQLDKSFMNNSTYKNVSMTCFQIFKILRFVTVYAYFKELATSPGVKAALKSTLAAIKLAAFIWFVDSYMFSNKGFHIYGVVYMLVLSLYGRIKNYIRLSGYLKNYPFEYQTQLLVQFFMRLVLFLFSFMCINSFIWYDNIMMNCFILFHFGLELWVLIRRNHDYEQDQYVSTYFTYFRH